MTTMTYAFTGRLVTVCCCVCGVTFGMDERYERNRRNDHESWYCPNGHRQYFSGRTETERLRDELESARSSLAYTRATLAQTEAQRRAQKGLVTKLKKRAEAGMCAYCNRTFQNYSRHMKTKHGEEEGR